MLGIALAIAVAGIWIVSDSARAERTVDARKFDGKTIALTAPCRVSKTATDVYVYVGDRDLRVELPAAFHRKFPAGDRAWIGLVGTCRLVPQGGPETAEQSDGYIEVDKVLFYDKGKDHEATIEIQ